MLSGKLWRAIILPTDVYKRQGEYRVGEKIMSERQMAMQYGINRLTVRSAIKKLVEEGTLVSIQGKGTFVSRLPKNEKKVPFGDAENVSLSRNLVQSGFQSTRTVLSFKRIENQGVTPVSYTHLDVYKRQERSTLHRVPTASDRKC